MTSCSFAPNIGGSDAKLPTERETSVVARPTRETEQQSEGPTRKRTIESTEEESSAEESELAPEETIEQTSEEETSGTTISDAWSGVYYYDNGDEGLYFFIEGIDQNGAFAGSYIYDGGDIFYDCNPLNWYLDPYDDYTASGHFQNDTYVHYQLFGDRIVADYPEGWWTDRNYYYVCELNQVRQYVNHSELEDALALFDWEEGSSEPFYGIWLTASKNRSDCEKTMNELRAAGFAAGIYLTSDWSNLNQEPWYAVSAGEYASEGAANQALAKVKAAGYSDAYVKYTGAHK